LRCLGMCYQATIARISAFIKDSIFAYSCQAQQKISISAVSRIKSYELDN
jgi:hypothetical protein